MLGKPVNEVNSKSLLSFLRTFRVLTQEASYHPIPQGTLFTLHIWSEADILGHHHGVAHQVPQRRTARSHT